MQPHPRILLAFSCALVCSFGARAQTLLPSSPLPLTSLAEFKSPGANWQLAGGIAGDPRREKAIVPIPGSGVLINNPTDSAKSALTTTWEHGDVELDLDFLLPPGSNSGVYLMGRYELQLADSWGVKVPTFADCGGIYQRWDDARGKDKEGFEGIAPRANASRAPGLWQHLRIEFQAPRFDAAGVKTSNARFVKVTLNDFVIHENVEVNGPTRGAAFPTENPRGPLLIQGDHGAIAFRNIASKRFDPEARVAVENLSYKYYPGELRVVGEYDNTAPARQGTPESFAAEAIDRTGRFAVVFAGALVVPRDGAYLFNAEATEPVRLLVDGQVAIAPLEQGGVSNVMTLKQGSHPFRLDYLHPTARAPALRLTAEGPGIAVHGLTENRARRPGNAPQLLVQPEDRIRLQRSFVPYEPKKRLYAISVGTPAGAHYSYDFETGAILRVWRGNFLDAFEMWEGRGEPQLAKPAGPALTLTAKPTIALLERATSEWPDAAEPLWSSNGYTLESDGQPTFAAKLATLDITDRVAPTADGRGLTRTINLKGTNTSWQTMVLLAEAPTITAQPDGLSFIVGDRDYYIDLPADSAVRPFVRNRGDHQQLVVPVTAAGITKPIIYTLLW
ncbi:MAG: family 16 glycoside hydrolase [Opitutaceae bacterium]